MGVASSKGDAAGGCDAGVELGRDGQYEGYEADLEHDNEMPVRKVSPLHCPITPSVEIWLRRCTSLHMRLSVCMPPSRCSLPAIDSDISAKCLKSTGTCILA